MNRANTTIRSVYKKHRCYGGPEEGGWDYTRYEYHRPAMEDEMPSDLDWNEIFIAECVAGEHDTMNQPKPIYQ
jgi:hypothetical protein